MSVIDKAQAANDFITRLSNGEAHYVVVPNEPWERPEDPFKKGYEQGVKDLAEKLKKFYDNYRGGTYSGSVSYHVEQIKKELLKEDENND